jgi:hypothetical protein
MRALWIGFTPLIQVGGSSTAAPLFNVRTIARVQPNQAEAAKAFIAYLKTPDAIAVIKAKGMTPG